jgi:hypothetical protein
MPDMLKNHVLIDYNIACPSSGFDTVIKRTYIISEISVDGFDENIHDV